MKTKTFQTIICVFGIICVIFVLGRMGWYETHYTKEAEVVSVKGNQVQVIDNHGDLWNFQGYGFTQGDKVSCTMNTNYTDLEYYDDIIENVRIK